MHGKLVLSPEYFHGAISDSVVQTFFFKCFLFCEMRRDSYAESWRTAPIFSLTLHSKAFLAITIALKCLY